MNWYKISQKIEEVGDRIEDPYTSVGHRERENCKSFLWLYMDGKLDIREFQRDQYGGFICHYEIWGDDFYKHYYNGRIDICKGKNPIISLRVPDHPIARFRDIPNRIINALLSKWPSAEIKVYR
jgi:hypothetical protein